LVLLSLHADPAPHHPSVASRATVLTALPRLGRTALLRHALHHEGWEVMEVYGIAACITQAKQCLPDLIVIDGVDALPFAVELLHAIRAHEIVGQTGIIASGLT
jgi:PleD family two-component response regulator